MNANGNVCSVAEKAFYLPVVECVFTVCISTFSENVDALKIAVFLANLIGIYEWSE